MEADFLRLILFLVGILAVLGVYFWERHKRVNVQVNAIRRAEQKVVEIRTEIEAEQTDSPQSEPDWGMESEQEQKPYIEQEPESEWVPQPGPEWGMESELEPKPELEPEPELVLELRPDLECKPESTDEDKKLAVELDLLDKMVHEEASPVADQATQIPLFITDDDEQEAASVADGAESKIILINLVAQGTAFAGVDILTAAASVGLKPGEMNIFHYSGKGRGRKKAKPLFSMVSMVEPGNFPLKKMAEFSTPGLALFMQLHGSSDATAMYSDMLSMAKKLAAKLAGELQDESHCSLTPQAIEYQREGIIEYQRQQLLAAKK
ncbi:hypothetical protein MNBD_GAMMA26-509 [hydrothermal vent metagenome]|uniref:ZipA C-terminal FtsZ-binding domain-containing protein n=1 Tax=hydrothermal vent metagenome TaxID=652676 RepID=A0A3B1AWY2_9ZZZZ